MAKVIVIGAGPAGIMAAIHASKKHNVTILDGNDRIGKKLFITGKGRCNVTNSKDISEFFDYIPGNPHFLYSALYSYTNEDTMNFFENVGIKLKVERGGRVFPMSDKSSDIIKGLSIGLKESNVQVKLNSKVTNIIYDANKIVGVEINNSTKLYGDYFIIATGGASYPLTGSRGEGQKFAKKLGHTIIELKPSLVPIELNEPWLKDLMGLSLKNVEIRMQCGKKTWYEGFGEMLFTHFGVSGPLILSASSFYSKNISKRKGDDEVKLFLDLKPALTPEQLDKRLLRDFEEAKNKQFKNALDHLFPAKLIPVMIELSGISPEKKVNEISREERKAFGMLIKALPMTVTGTRSFAEAIITQGGISVKDINPSTMESRLVKHLYFAGEVLDLDAMTGGFNLQIAWSTGHLAGESIQ